MTFLRELPAHKEYRCDICGFVGIWSDSWKRWSSLALDETCPNEVPTVCSEPCAAELKGRLESGLFKLPKLRGDAGGFKVTKPRQGY